MRYAVARFQREQRDMAYRFYIAECLRMITNNTAHPFGGTVMEAKLYEILYGKKEDNKTADEIIADVLSRSGIEVI